MICLLIFRPIITNSKIKYFFYNNFRWYSWKFWWSQKSVQWITRMVTLLHAVKYTMRFKFSCMQHLIKKKKYPQHTNSRRRFEKLKIYVFIVCFICNCISSLKSRSKKSIQQEWGFNDDDTFGMDESRRRRRIFTELAHLWASELMQKTTTIEKQYMRDDDRKKDVPTKK